MRKVIVILLVIAWIILGFIFLQKANSQAVIPIERFDTLKVRKSKQKVLYNQFRDYLEWKHKIDSLKK